MVLLEVLPSSESFSMFAVWMLVSTCWSSQAWPLMLKQNKLQNIQNVEAHLTRILISPAPWRIRTVNTKISTNKDQWNSAYIFSSSMNKSPLTLQITSDHNNWIWTTDLLLGFKVTTTNQSMVNKDKTLAYHDIYCDFLLSTSLLTPNRHYIISLRDRWG